MHNLHDQNMSLFFFNQAELNKMHTLLKFQNLVDCQGRQLVFC